MISEVVISFIFVLLVVEGMACPTTIQSPCICASTRYEPISIQCDQADSLETVMRALADPPPYIDSLIISNTPIETIPANVFQGLSIKRLVFRNNGLESVQAKAFDGPLLDVLQELEFRSNKLKNVPQDGVPELRSLFTLILSDNHINEIPDYTFLTYYSRNVLRRIDLSSNNISAMAPQSLLGLEDLRILALDKNLFTEIPTESLRSLVTLEEFSMGVNHVKSIPIGALPLPNLKSLSLEVNQISVINQEAFQQLPNLLYLYLSNNQISEVNKNMFYYVKGLKVLAIGNNPYLSSLKNDTFLYVPSLVRVELSDCGIEHIEEGTFQKIPKIQVIVLSRNSLERVSQSMFAHLSHISSIDLRQNKIKWIDDFAFSQMSELQMLDLSANELETLMPNTFFNSLLTVDQTVTRVLNVYDNPWMCNENIEWFIQWLKENPDVQTTAPGNRPAKCANPSHLHDVELKNANISRLKTISTEETTRITSYGGAQTIATAKTNIPFNNYPTTQWPLPVDTITDRNGKIFSRKPLPEPLDISNTTLGLIIAGVFTGLLAFTMILIAIIRYSIKKAQKQQDDHRELNSSSHGSTTGFNPIYAGPGIFTCDRSHYAQNWNLRHSPEIIDDHRNRSYWWF